MALARIRVWIVAHLINPYVLVARLVDTHAQQTLFPVLSTGHFDDSNGFLLRPGRNQFQCLDRSCDKTQRRFPLSFRSRQRQPCTALALVRCRNTDTAEVYFPLIFDSSLRLTC